MLSSLRKSEIHTLPPNQQKKKKPPLKIILRLRHNLIQSSEKQTSEMFFLIDATPITENRDIG